ncbi:MAG: heavy metal-responsive transcriptional regulator [Acidimicrobiia bacterium]
MQIGELSAVTGVSVRTIRFYEERGILPAPDRTPAGYRSYDPDAISRLRFLRSAQAAGLTLAEIAGILTVRDRGEAPCDHTRHLLQAKRQEVAGRIEQLRSLADELERLLAAGQAIDSRVCRAEDVCSIIPARP